MRTILTMAMLGSIAAPAAAHELADLLPGTFTNTEQAYFQGEAGEPQDRPVNLRFTAGGDGAFLLQPIDAFGEPAGSREAVTVTPRGDRTALSSRDCTRLFRGDRKAFVLDTSEGECAVLPSVMQRIGPEGIMMAWPDGRPLELRRARPVSCWISVRKTDPIPEGESEWTFDSGLMIHDQGGRIRAAGGDSGAPVAIVRMRNVIWPPPMRNRPSLVLYVHTEDDPDRAVSYSWADLSANRVGINLRWMQASCTVQTENRGDE